MYELQHVASHWKLNRRLYKRRVTWQMLEYFATMNAAHLHIVWLEDCFVDLENGRDRRMFPILHYLFSSCYLLKCYRFLVCALILSRKNYKTAVQPSSTVCLSVNAACLHVQIYTYVAYTIRNEQIRRMENAIYHRSWKKESLTNFVNMKGA